MDLGDLLILIFIAFGVLSSLFGGKKKKGKLAQTRRPPGRARPEPRSRPAPPAGRRASSGAATSRREAATTPFPAAGSSQESTPYPEMPSRMEEILRQLGLEVEIEPQPEPEIPEPEPHREYDAAGRALPGAVAWGGEKPEGRIPPSAVERHQEFHDQFITEFQETKIEKPPSRARLQLNPQSLRDAMILHVILGPPKGMR